MYNTDLMKLPLKVNKAITWEIFTKNVFTINFSQ